MFADASAIVAILLAEPDMQDFRARMKTSRRYTSSIAVYEAAMAVARESRKSATESHAVVMGFLEAYRIQVLPIEKQHAGLALEAFDRFCKGRHKASLNMGDCFSYACARSQKVPLLCKGNDFIHTDIAIA